MSENAAFFGSNQRPDWILPQTCRYCKVPRSRPRTRCENCGAPYPALETS